ncbi:hypothetical protein [Bailinhaonella thermotolerans]|uniref:Uncharacterized protein n=1 Tax=Bailinhaonella thermotolerans TaxID=1070861 RepID=A0A3A4A9T0_9ACTN|nr:hypothetical protein [Bailinhaonella thermotolerans]RJL22086.1 hypothetical protein D5H75_36450 [Bailinhaonella thermotolerans]
MGGHRPAVALSPRALGRLIAVAGFAAVAWLLAGASHAEADGTGESAVPLNVDDAAVRCLLDCLGGVTNQDLGPGFSHNGSVQIQRDRLQRDVQHDVQRVGRGVARVDDSVRDQMGGLRGLLAPAARTASATGGESARRDDGDALWPGTIRRLLTTPVSLRDLDVQESQARRARDAEVDKLLRSLGVSTPAIQGFDPTIMDVGSVSPEAFAKHPVAAAGAGRKAPARAGDDGARRPLREAPLPGAPLPAAPAPAAPASAPAPSAAGGPAGAPLGGVISTEATRFAMGADGLAAVARRSADAPIFQAATGDPTLRPD